MNWLALFNNSNLKALINGVVIAAVSVWGYYQAYHSGVNAAKLETEQRQNQTLSAQLSDLDDQIRSAHQTSLSLNENLHRYHQLGEKTSDELQTILAQTAHARAECRFDADSLRKLEQSRQRAVSAVTGGVAGALPDSDRRAQ